MFNGELCLYAAGAGSSQCINNMLSNLNIDDNTDYKMSCLLFTTDNIYENEGRGWRPFNENKDFLSIGSGMPFALSAMNLGLNATQAVKHAMKFDIYSGGVIQSIKIGNKYK